MATDAQRKAQRKYTASKLRRFTVTYNRVSDSAVIAWLESQPNTHAAIKRAILEAVNKDA